MVYLRGRGLVENEEQDENKMMKSIVVEEQEQEQEQDEGSETRFVDLDPDTLRNVLGRVDMFTLGRAACVNTLWCGVATDERLWDPIFIRVLASSGELWKIRRCRSGISRRIFRRLFFGRIISVLAKPPPDFYSIDFSKEIKPWVQN